MIEFLKVTLCFFALCGVLYLLRDAARAVTARRCRQSFSVVLPACAVPDERKALRAFSMLATLLSHPEAKYLVRRIYLVDAQIHQMPYLYEAAHRNDLDLECVEAGQLILRLRSEE